MNNLLLLKQEIRPTPTRLALLKLLESSDGPKTIQEILTNFPHSVHKVTLYRDLKVFIAAGLVRECRLNERSARYQLIGPQHTHNLVCESCGLIDQVELPHDLDQQESQINAEKSFQVTTHALEFYGLCASCQKC